LPPAAGDPGASAPNFAPEGASGKGMGIPPAGISLGGPEGVKAVAFAPEEAPADPAVALAPVPALAPEVVLAPEAAEVALAPAAGLVALAPADGLSSE